MSDDELRACSDLPLVYSDHEGIVLAEQQAATWIRGGVVYVSTGPITI